LTDREREVLSLIAAGHSNRGIGDRLFLSARGVERHVTSIYNKLDIVATALYHPRVLATLAYLGASTNSGISRSTAAWYSAKSG
jgi:DNA-binding NarL/FixJ family response regulator